MKKTKIIGALCAIIIAASVQAQDLKEKDVPATVKTALKQKYPEAGKVSWEKEKGNFEANWGGKSGEDNSAIFTPSGVFQELVQAIPIDQLPSTVASYVTKHYHGSKIREAGKLTDASGKHFFEVEIKRKDLIFDEQGNFVKEG